MSFHSNTLLGLVLCLAQTIHVQDGSLPNPSIRAEPGSVVSRGQSVTIVCRSPATADAFRLEKADRSGKYVDEKKVSEHDSQETEARFLLTSVSEDTAGSYRCLYKKISSWSKRSQPLELTVTDEDVSTQPSGLSTQYIYILVGISVAFLLCLLLLVLLLHHHQCKKKHGSPRSKSEKKKPQERLSPAIDILESTPDVATVNTVPEKNRERHSSSPAAGDTQEVIYAQLDQQALTMRAARSVSPSSTEPTADSSLYAALAKQ